MRTVQDLARHREKQFLKLNEIDGDLAINDKENQKKGVNARIRDLDRQQEDLEKSSEKKLNEIQDLKLLELSKCLRRFLTLIPR